MLNAALSLTRPGLRLRTARAEAEAAANEAPDSPASYYSALERSDSWASFSSSSRGHDSRPASPRGGERSATPSLLEVRAAAQRAVSSPAGGTATPPPTPLSEAVGLRRWEGPLEEPVVWALDPPRDKRGTWWPMYSWFEGVGDARLNLWAVGGALEKYDLVSGAASRADALRNRRRSFPDLVDQWSGDKGRWDVFNAGHCNQSAMRVAFFPNPKYPVRKKLPNDPMARTRLASFASLPVVRDALEVGPSLAREAVSQTRDVPLFGGLVRKAVDLAVWASEREEVEFTTEDIQGLMTICMDDLVDITRGTNGFEYVGYAYQGPAPAGMPPTLHNVKDEPYPHQVIDWVARGWGRDQQRPIFADCNPEKEIMNRLYDGGKVVQLAEPPSDFDPRVVPPGGTVKYYRVEFTNHSEPDYDIRNDGWIHTSDEGVKTSHWIQDPEPGSPRAQLPRPETDAPRTSNGDFYWITHLQPKVLEGAPWIGFANKVNPEVDMLFVWSLYKESRGERWTDIAHRYPERIERHFEIAGRRFQGNTPWYLDRLRTEYYFTQPVTDRSEPDATTK